ncbi:hypothetical protein [Mycolicibacterium arenosum]|uniref:ESAT-6-like protein n=1 Tax=Mycolicibacterium arenosum TaxID=2952157 RepID=A0ABT1LXC7_9MYCO|nr:hypothetical protein [Mycolicibacterium sp. CAU 1645]MCP9271548.1 hypothetical protein [Mycolicibacterium sp. CAU 1645]
MSGTIHYNYGANYEQLDAIKATLNDANALREDVNSVFTALADVYEGEAAAALQTAQIQVTQQLDAAILEIQGTQQAAVDRQAMTAEHDRSLAGGF